MELYDGFTDRDEHLDMYVTQVGLYIFNDAIFCQVFPTSLKGVALSWFTCLPPNFRTLASKFEAQFATSRPHQLTSLVLVNVRQEKMKRYMLSWSNLVK